MPKIICELENASTEINGIKFVVGEDGRLISEADVGEPHLSIFLSIPGFSADGADEDGDKKDPAPAKAIEPAQKQETAAQRKARLKAEQEAAEKAEAERLAAEEAQRKAEEEAAKQNEGGEGDNGAGTGEPETVF